MSEHDYQSLFQSSFHDGTIDLFVETLTGTTFEVTVSPFDTVMSIKLKIQRVEGIPVSQQHLLYNMRELEDRSCLIDCAIHHGATLKLVLSIRGGPVSTRRLPSLDNLAWRELQELVENSREEVGDQLPPGCHVTILVFRDADQVNLFRVVENEDGTYSPLSESSADNTIRNLFAEEACEGVGQRLQENSVTMAKMQDLKSRLETLSLHKKPKRSSACTASGKHMQPNRVETSIQAQFSHKSDVRNKVRLPKNHLSLPPLSGSVTQQSYLENSSLLSVQYSQQSSDDSSTSASLLQSDSNCTDLPVSLCRSQSGVESALPSLLSTPQHLNSRQNGNVTSLRVLPQLRNSIGFDCGRNIPVSDTNKTVCRTGETPLGESSSINILSSSDITILEEDGDTDLQKRFPASHGALSVSGEDATVAISRYPRERVATAAVKNGPNRYRVSHVILDEDDRPKTSPEDLSHRQKTAQELCNILSESKWHGHNPRRRDRNTSSIPQLDVQNKLQQKHNARLESNNRCMVSNIEALTHSTLIKVAGSSPRYGRRSMHQPTFTQCHSLGSETGSMSCRQTDVQVQRRAPSARKSEIGLPATSKKHVRSRCAECRKRLNITNVYTCRCEKMFCSTHRYSEVHGCTYDYKSEGRRFLEQANPLVAAPKLPKI